MALTEREVATLIDWRVGRIQSLTEEAHLCHRKAKRKGLFSGEGAAEESFCQQEILPRQQYQDRLKQEIEQMDPQAKIRRKLLGIYLDQLDKTRDNAYLEKIKNLGLTTPFLVRVLFRRLSGQYANTRLCLLSMRSLMGEKGGKLFKVRIGRD